MLAVSWAARRWGPGIGGLLAGLPLTSGPISIYLYAEQGPHFAASAAANSILSLTPVALFSVVYTRLSGHRQVVSCTLGSFGAFLLALYFLQKSGFSFWVSWITGFLAISLGLMLTPNKVPAKFKIHYPRWDLPARVFSATAMVLTITLSASFLDPSGAAYFRQFQSWHGPCVCLFTINRGAMGLEQYSAEFSRVLTAYWSSTPSSPKDLAISRQSWFTSPRWLLP